MIALIVYTEHLISIRLNYIEVNIQHAFNYIMAFILLHDIEGSDRVTITELSAQIIKVDSIPFIIIW